MIQFILLQNRQGKTRLSKYYRSYTDDEKNKIEGEIHRLVTSRDSKFTNFVEVGGEGGRRRVGKTPARGLTSLPAARSSGSTNLFTGDTLGSSLPSALTQRTTS